MEEKIIKQIDFARIVKMLWGYRKKYCIVLPVVLVCTYLIILMVPRYYRCSVSLAPESTSGMAGGIRGSLASSFGLGSIAKLAGGEDALNVELYPDILSSKNFIATLMPVEVTTQKDGAKYNYYTYLKTKQGAAPWDKARNWVKELVKPTPPDSYSGKERISVFNLTKQQSDIFESVAAKVKCVLDKKTGVATITVEDQDPLVCAIIANATCQKLQDFIIDYRTKKARVDYEYYKKLCAEAKAKYERSRQIYGSYSDSNMDVVLQSYKSKEEDLENEMQLRYNIYTAMNTQMQAAQAKLQEATPAFTMLQSASVPVKPAGPKRVFMSIGMMVLAFIVMTVWLINKNGGLLTQTNITKESEA